MASLRMDNPTVRKLQEEETAKYFPEASVRKQLKDTVGAWVEVVYLDPKDDCSGIGRAVAITPDGYYLTAWHVVDEAPVFMVEITQTRPLPPRESFKYDDYHSRKSYAGRIVWIYPDLDLALMKFERTDVKHVEKMRLRVNKNELVYTADEKGWGQLSSAKGEVINIRDALNGMVGNGSFFSAGKVVSSKSQDSQGRSRSHCLTLVARGGMSGGPLLTVDNELCGILVRGSVHRDLLHWSRLISRSHAAMMDPEFIRERIQEDRAGRT